VLIAQLYRWDDLTVEECTLGTVLVEDVDDVLPVEESVFFSGTRETVRLTYRCMVHHPTAILSHSGERSRAELTKVNAAVPATVQLVIT
jgi:hypothetical protein